MGLLSRIFKPQETRDSLANPSPFLVSYFGGQESFAGRYVNADSAMQATAVFACVRLISGTIGSLPFVVFQEKRSGTKKLVMDHPLSYVMNSTPNADQTPVEFREMLQGHIELRGNSYAQIIRDAGNDVAELVPLNPDRMKVRRNLKTQQIEYAYKLSDGQERIFRPDQILHGRSLTLDGIMGVSPIAACKEAIGLALGVEEFGSRLFGNGTNLGGILTHPGTVSEQAYERMKEEWKRKKAGLRNAHDVLILEEDLKYTKLGMTNEESQFLLTRKFQLQEIARIFGVPPHMIADLERSTNNNIEHQAIEFVTHTVRPRVIRQEQTIQRSLLTEKERRLGYGVEYRMDALLRGDKQSRYTSYAVGRQWGWLSANDVRDSENIERLPPEIGDVYLVPLNMVPPDGGLPAADGATNPNESKPSPEAEPGGGNPEDPSDMPDSEKGKKKRDLGYQLAFAKVFDDKIAQIRRKEMPAINRLAKKASSLEEFQKLANEFYADGHRQFVIDVMRPAVEAYAHGLGFDSPSHEIDSNSFLEKFARTTVDRSLIAIRSAELNEQSIHSPERKIRQFDEQRGGPIAWELYEHLAKGSAKDEA